MSKYKKGASAMAQTQLAQNVPINMHTRKKIDQVSTAKAVPENRGKTMESDKGEMSPKAEAAKMQLKRTPR
jgi:hypothetical protein